MKLFRLTFIVFLLIGCNKDDLPTQPSEFGKGEYTGTFSVTFKNYQNQSSPVTQSGNISITFSDSTYSYSAIEAKTNSTLNDVGNYLTVDAKMQMNDQSWLYMDPRWHNSLYLMDTFSIQKTNNQFVISQDNDFANWKIILIPKK